MQKYTFISNHQFILTNDSTYHNASFLMGGETTLELLLVFGNAKEVRLLPELDIA